MVGIVKDMKEAHHDAKAVAATTVAAAGGSTGAGGTAGGHVGLGALNTDVAARLADKKSQEVREGVAQDETSHGVGGRGKGTAAAACCGPQCVGKGV